MENEMMERSEILLYSDENGKEFVSVVFKDETFWLTQKAMAELFGCTPDNISLHLKNIFAESELNREAVTEKFSATAADGKNYLTQHYNLDAIIAVGYRVNSKKATRFRQWATKTLKEYIQKGFVLNDDLMKNGRPFGKDYLTNCSNASGRFAPANAELIRKSRMSLSNAATITTKAATPQRHFTRSYKTSCITPSPARLPRS